MSHSEHPTALHPQHPQAPRKQGDSGRFQGGAGGQASNAGPYAETEPYGGPQDQLGYGSTPEKPQRARPTTSVGAGPGGSMSGTSDAG